MTLKTQMTADLPVFFDTDEFGFEVLYTPSGGDAVLITVIQQEIDPSIMVDYDPPADSMVLIVKTSDIASPCRGDTFTIDGETWYLIKNSGGGSHENIWELIVSRSDKALF